MLTVVILVILVILVIVGIVGIVIRLMIISNTLKVSAHIRWRAEADEGDGAPARQHSVIRGKRLSNTTPNLPTNITPTNIA